MNLFIILFILRIKAMGGITLTGSELIGFLEDGDGDDVLSISKEVPLESNIEERFIVIARLGAVLVCVGQINLVGVKISVTTLEAVLYEDQGSLRQFFRRLCHSCV